LVIGPFFISPAAGTTGLGGGASFFPGLRQAGSMARMKEFCRILDPAVLVFI